MTRSIRTALALSAVALVVPTAALAAHRAAPVNLRGNAVTVPLSAVVAGYSGGVLTLTLPSGATVVGSAGPQSTRFVCPRTNTGPRRGAPPPPPCDVTQLVPGEGVASAVVTLSPTGMTFRQLVLMPPAGPPPGTAV